MAIHDDFDESIGFGFKDVGVILNNAKGRSFGWRRRNFISKIVPRGDFFAAQHEVLKVDVTDGWNVFCWAAHKAINQNKRPFLKINVRVAPHI